MKFTWGITGAALRIVLPSSATAASTHKFGSIEIFPRQQIVFPPANGPCLQNVGKPPLNCIDKQCIDIPANGVCNIQSQNGFPLCGCCPVGESMACSQCGGDAGGGICNGSGQSKIAYQGCSCTAENGEFPSDSTKVCPENKGGSTAKCSSCGGDATVKGVCANKQIFKDSQGRGQFTHCACCPADKVSDCNDCGGDNGKGKCKGLPSPWSTAYQGCQCGGGGGIDLPPPIIPFPIPPPGFPIVPPGTGNPKKPCSDTLGKCSECEGKNGWCQSGDSVGCPCQEECKTGEDQPNCSDETCQGIDKNKCAVGPGKDCDCQKDDQCPDEDEELGCEECGGADDKGKCKGIAGSNNLWKECDCWDDTRVGRPYKAFDVNNLAKAQAAMAGLPDVGVTPSTPTKDPKDVTCSQNNVQQVPKIIVTQTEQIDPNTLLFRMREVVCSNKCQAPPGIPLTAIAITQNSDKSDCELSIALTGGIEAWVYRQTPSVGDQVQQCWDSTATVINKCVNNGPNKGWWNGPSTYQFYETGFRPLNGEGSKHPPLDGNNALGGPAPVITPSKRDGTIDCADNAQAGTRMMNCLWPAGSAIVQGQRLDGSSKICTSDPSNNCIKYGQNFNDKGELLGSWCVVAAQNGCAFVIADKDPHFGGGFLGNSCISGQNLIDMSIKGANQCSGNNPGTAIAAGPVQSLNIPSQSLCLVSSDHPEICAVN